MHEPLVTWLSQNTSILAAVAGFSLFLLTTSLLATPWVLARLPANYFSKPPAVKPRSARRLCASVVKTVLGSLMILAGIAMMFTPGPGLVCLVLGMALCEFPGKHRLLKRVIRRPSVFSTLNWLRRKASKPPFVLPASD